MASAASRASSVHQASSDVLASRATADLATTAAINDYLTQLKRQLQIQILGGPGSVTDFRHFTASRLIADVDRLIADSQRKLTTVAGQDITSAADLGQDHVDSAVGAGGFRVSFNLPGIDRQLVSAAYSNAADLLTEPMQQFRNQVVSGIRAVAVAGDNRFEQIARLRDVIDGQGFDSAQMKAERIIRTEVGRTFNQATYDRLVALAADFPFLRKGWGGVKDSRTRQGHLDAQKDFARGKGIPVGDPFSVGVYTGKGVYQGTVLMRFPIDPSASPAGKLAAAATIFCRCNSFVDIDLADFQQFATQQVRTAVGTPLPPPPTPVVPPLPTAPLHLVPVPTAGTVRAAEPVFVPSGTPVSSAIKIDAQLRQPDRLGNLPVARDAYRLLDTVHGDGALPEIPLGMDRATDALGYYATTPPSQANGWTAKPVAIGLSPEGLSEHPYNTIFHETGHFLDHQVLAKLPPGADISTDTTGLSVPGVFSSTRGENSLMKEWRAAIRDTKTVKLLQQWRDVTRGKAVGLSEGDGVIPNFLRPAHLDYLLTDYELFARSYAQYIATKVGGVAGDELKMMQDFVTTGPVPKGAVGFGEMHAANRPPVHWSYPTVWQTEDFAPLVRVFDRLMENMQWTRSSK